MIDGLEANFMMGDVMDGFFFGGWADGLLLLSRFLHVVGNIDRVQLVG